jgi:hypothetical protein
MEMAYFKSALDYLQDFSDAIEGGILRLRGAALIAQNPEAVASRWDIQKELEAGLSRGAEVTVSIKVRGPSD